MSHIHQVNEKFLSCSETQERGFKLEFLINRSAWHQHVPIGKEMRLLLADINVNKKCDVQQSL